jgi:hypothetical protein
LTLRVKARTQSRAVPAGRLRRPMTGQLRRGRPRLPASARLRLAARPFGACTCGLRRVRSNVPCEQGARRSAASPCRQAGFARR